MPNIPLEDNFTDILGKAQRGLGFGDAELARRAGVSTSQLSAAKAGWPATAGRVEETVIRKLATALNLGADALVASARQAWFPANPGIFSDTQAGTPSSAEAAADKPAPPTSGMIEGLACFNTPFSDMTVNAYLVFDPKTRRAAVFDTGTDCDPMLKLARDHGLKIELILLTHTHGDHVYELDRLKEATGAPAYVSEREPLAGAAPFADGHVFELVERASRPLTRESGTGGSAESPRSVPPVGPKTGETPAPLGRDKRAGRPFHRTDETPVPLGGDERAGRPFHLTIETRRTSGHARGGTTFVVTGLAPNSSGQARRLAIVGDALFAGSMGGGLVDYDEALRTNRESIFTLPDDTIICPGHGPLTTVGEEKQHNPFFPEFQKQ